MSAFATTGAAILRQLSIRSTGDSLRTGLAGMEAALRASSVRLAVDGDILRVNDIAVPATSATDWLTPLAAGGVTEVVFEQDTTARELLLFLALLVAPGDAAAFATTWMANGSWRIHVTTTHDAAAADSAALATTIPPGPLASLCAAVARGDARTPDSTVLQELRGHGAEATEALLQALAHTEVGCQRRCLFDAIVLVGEGSEQLIAALRHDDWRVARNAAALLGELKVDAATAPLIAARTHAEHRVRVAVVTSLGQLDTPTAREAVASMVDDGHPQVRTRAWSILANGTEPPPSSLLDAALRRAEVPEVQYAILTCAAAFPQLDVASALVRFCAREFSQRSTKELLVFGVEQLALRSPASAKAFVARLPERLAQSA